MYEEPSVSTDHGRLLEYCHSALEPTLGTLTQGLLGAPESLFISVPVEQESPQLSCFLQLEVSRGFRRGGLIGRLCFLAGC